MVTTYDTMDDVPGTRAIALDRARREHAAQIVKRQRAGGKSSLSWAVTWVFVFGTATGLVISALNDPTFTVERLRVVCILWVVLVAQIGSAMLVDRTSRALGRVDAMAQLTCDIVESIEAVGDSDDPWRSTEGIYVLIH